MGYRPANLTQPQSGYRHSDVVISQCAKRPGDACGDVVRVERSPAATLVVCADGLGSGIKANVSALFTISRLLGLMRGGCSLREAFSRLVSTLNAAREPGLPYAAFSIARLLPDGHATVLSYESPPPILVSYHTASVLSQHSFERDGAIIGEAQCRLEPHEGLLMVSDGVTQAGMGAGLPMGWQIHGVAKFARDQRHTGAPLHELPEAIQRHARKLWGAHQGDDITACLVACREGRVVTLFTGPPVNRRDDLKTVRRFLATPGAKVICGATTARIVADYLGHELKVSEDSLDGIAPPYYTLEDIDLVTEGAVTLNQVYNVLDADIRQLPPNSGVGKLCQLLREADRIDVLVGQASNVAGEDIVFRQQGILPRTTIIPLLVDKLRHMDKLVTLRFT